MKTEERDYGSAALAYKVLIHAFKRLKTFNSGKLILIVYFDLADLVASTIVKSLR